MSRPIWLSRPGLSGEALSQWKRHAPRLFADGWLTAENCEDFRRLCNLLSLQRWLRPT